jgi:hypothetical protein
MNGPINELGDAPNAQSRVAKFQIPGSTVTFELVEHKGIQRNPPAHPHYEDPDVTCLILFVRDIDEMIGKLKGANALLISTGGQTVTLNSPKSTARVIFAQDPDGFFHWTIAANAAS